MKNSILFLLLFFLYSGISPAQINKKFTGNTGNVHAVAFSPGGKYIAGGGLDNVIRIWDFETGNLVNKIDIGKSIYKLYFDAETENIVAGTAPLIGISGVFESFLDIYNIFSEKKNETAKIKSKSPNFFLTKSGNKITTVLPEVYLDSCKYVVDYNIENYMGGKCYKVFLSNYDLSTGNIENLEIKDRIGSWNFNYPVTISENGKYLSIYSLPDIESKAKKIDMAGIEKSRDIGLNKQKNFLYIFDVDNLKMIKRTILIDDYFGQNNMLLSNDGSYLIYTDKNYFNYVIKVMDIEKDKEVSVLSGHSREIFCLAMHPSGKFIASGGRDKTIRLWDIKTGKELKVFEDNDDYVNFLTFSSDGRYLASASDDKLVQVRDLSQISKVIELYSLKYNIDKGLGDYVNELKNEEIRKAGNSEINMKVLDEKYLQLYKELYDKTLEEYNKKNNK